jgi:hypothetical protein
MYELGIGQGIFLWIWKRKRFGGGTIHVLYIYTDVLSSILLSDDDDEDHVVNFSTREFKLIHIFSD